MKSFVRSNIRPIALAILSPVFGFSLFFLLKISLGLNFPDILKNLINFAIAALFGLVVFPKFFGIPFGKLELRPYLKRIGFYFPREAWKHLLLGLVLSICTLSGMLLASLLTGKYTLDPSTITLEHLVFSLNPAFWEEFFYRGVIMMFLLAKTRSLGKSALIQIVLFGLLHFSGTSPWDLVDMLSVMLIAILFTYTAWQTKSLLASIVFHYFHDAFIFFVQLPGETVTTNAEKTLFFGLLWCMIVIGMIVVNLFSKWLSPTSPPLYTISLPGGSENLTRGNL